jgi:hypothetical protein
MPDKSQPKTETKGSWEVPSLRKVGSVGKVLRGGGGKLSVMADDMGDVRKPKGTE